MNKWVVGMGLDVPDGLIGRIGWMGWVGLVA